MEEGQVLSTALAIALNYENPDILHNIYTSLIYLLM